MATWTFSHQSRVVRFYLWFYKADPKKLTFCTLFWGLLFAPILLPFRVLGKPLVPILERMMDRLDERYMNKPHKDHPKLEKAAGLINGPLIRILIILLLPLAVWECYRNPWWTIGWVPYFMFYAWQYFGVKKTQFGAFLTDGYHSIKERSCPTIDVK